ncbi:MAG TPA: hypothetical protein DEB57_03600 [Microbacterium sp.]|nr:hypothetical protein [Microbacterium sp.]
MLMNRRGFVLRTSMVTLGGCLAPSALAREGLARVGRTRLGLEEQILDWAKLTGQTKAVVNLALGGNSVMVVSGGEALVIDSKFPYLGPALREDAKAEAGGDSVSLLNTHHHGDHTGGNSAFVGRGKTYAHPKAIERIRGQIDNYRTGAEAAVGQVSQNLAGNRRAIELAVEVAENAANMSADDFVPTDAVEGGSRIDVGELTLDIHHFGAGHTDNDIVVHIASENVVHTGDLVFNGLHPYFDPRGGVTAKGWIRSLSSVLDLCDDETTVVPGHGPVGGREIIEKARGYLEQLVEAVGAEIEKGTSKEDAQQMTWPFMDGLGFEQVKSRAVGAVYDQIKGS